MYCTTVRGELVWAAAAPVGKQSFNQWAFERITACWRHLTLNRPSWIKPGLYPVRGSRSDTAELNCEYSSQPLSTTSSSLLIVWFLIKQMYMLGKKRKAFQSQIITLELELWIQNIAGTCDKWNKISWLGTHTSGLLPSSQRSSWDMQLWDKMLQRGNMPHHNPSISEGIHFRVLWRNNSTSYKVR